MLDIDDALDPHKAHAVKARHHTSAVRTALGGGAVLLEPSGARGQHVHALARADGHFLVDDAFGGR